jgi:hypothetical protein
MPALTRASVTGASATSIMPKPTTSVVFIGEFPSRKSPCDDESAKIRPSGVWDDWAATHQLMAYRPASLKVITPVMLL